MEPMNAKLETQYLTARSMVQEAANRGDVALAKYGVGIMLGILAASLPEDDSHALFRSSMDVGNCRTINEVLDFASMLARRSSDVF